MLIIRLKTVDVILEIIKFDKLKIDFIRTVPSPKKAAGTANVFYCIHKVKEYTASDTFQCYYSVLRKNPMKR